MASTIDKVKHALHLDKDKSTSTTHTHATETTGHTTGHTAGSGLTGNTHTGHTAGSGLTGNTHTGHTAGSGLTGNTHTGHTAGSGLTGNNYGSTNAGPHDSNTANKLDPRVDSDRSGVHGHSTTGTGFGNTAGTHTGTTGGISHSTNAGPHNSNLLNKADPLVDSDLDGRGNRHGAHTGGIMGASGSHATPGSGTAQNTAGPHNSDMLNKVDPRVDSDRDGSKTYGGNKTHA